MPLSNWRRKPRLLKHAGMQEFFLFARAASSVGSEKPTASERCSVQTIIDALIDLPSPALKARLAATENALAAAKSEREASKRFETAKAKHRDLLNLQVVYSRLAGTRNIETRASGYDAALAPNVPLPRPITPWRCSGSITGR